MLSSRLPTDTWMVIDVRAGWRAISLHSCRRDAEIERDKRNQGVTVKPFTACLVLEPVAERMSRPWR
jgi:hypothetical protein